MDQTSIREYMYIYIYTYYDYVEPQNDDMHKHAKTFDQFGILWWGFFGAQNKCLIQKRLPWFDQPLGTMGISRFPWSAEDSKDMLEVDMSTGFVVFVDVFWICWAYG